MGLRESENAACERFRGVHAQARVWQSIACARFLALLRRNAPTRVVQKDRGPPSVNVWRANVAGSMLPLTRCYVAILDCYFERAASVWRLLVGQPKR